MKQLLLLLSFTIWCNLLSAQTSKIELSTLIEKFICDSTGYENVGDWDATNTLKLPIKWKTAQIEMSDDTSINFFRSGTANITINGKSFMRAGTPVVWNLMVKGPRMGYTNFSIVSSPSNEISAKYTIDSLFGKKNFRARLLKSCESNPVTGFYYYELKLPKKDVVFLKITWITVNGNNAIRIDCYDNYSKYAAKLTCK